MKGEEQQIKKAAVQTGTDLKNANTGQMTAVLQKATRQGTSAKDALGLTDAMVEGIYGQAYRLYNTGKYKESSQIFRLLLMINSTEPKYAMGLAACFHMLKDYKSAVNTYTVVGIIDPNSPISYYHASDCFMQMGDPTSALIALEMAIKKAEDKPQFKTLKDRAMLTGESIKKDLKNQEKK